MSEVTKKRRRSLEQVDDTEEPSHSRKAKLNDPNGSPLPVVELNTVFDLIRARADEPDLRDETSLYYPSIGTNYIGYTASGVFDLSRRAARYYSQILPARTSSDVPPAVVALLGPSNIEYFISLLGISLLGHTLLLLSSRLSEEGHVSLLEATKAAYIFVDDNLQSMGDKVSKHFTSLPVHPIASMKEIEMRAKFPPMNTSLDPKRERDNIAWIIHSSGSTSLPKPNYSTHAAALANFKSQFHLIGFITLPLYHAQGLGCVFRSIMNRVPIYMYNAALPLTSQHLLTTLREHPDIQILYGVPYVMKLLADKEEGIESCKKLDVLFCGGGACPKPIGDKLAQNGVYLVSHVGSSETGQLMNSYRPRSEIEEWDWLRPPPNLQPYLRWEPYDLPNNIFEMVVLDGWPSKVVTNREDGAYATKDLWERHAKYPAKNAWRFYARKDDTIVLSNGEKANPIIFEDAARRSPLVEDAIVFGSEKPNLGLFIVASDDVEATEAEIKDDVWLAIQSCNKIAPAHAQISVDMIHFLSPSDAKRIRRTDKSGLIRSAFYKDFAPLIDTLYKEPKTRGILLLDQEGLRSFLHKEIEALVDRDRTQMIKDDVDLFALGIDSLQASRIRSAILKRLDTGKGTVGENFVFDFPSISAMARELYRMREEGEKESTVPAHDKMTSLIRKYGTGFSLHQPVLGAMGQSVLLTGVTGSLGAHVLAQLVSRSDISKIYCLIRARTNSEALKRLRESLSERKLEVDLGRIRALAADLSDSQLGLSGASYKDLVDHVTCVIHCAWNVNFRLSLESLEKDCIGGTRHLISLCLQSKQEVPADFIFCSSISTYANGATIPEELPSSLKAAHTTGYAQSKLIAEHMCYNASTDTGMSVRVLRIGQISGDSKFGIWNPQEAIPMIMQSGKTIGVLPMLDEECSWLPVDIVAESVVEIWSSTRRKSGFDVYNVVNPTSFHWSKDLLPMLESSGMGFDVVSPREWLKRLESNSDLRLNPPYKLIDFFLSKYGNENPRKTTYLTDKARATSRALSDAPNLDQTLVNKYTKYILSKLPQ